MKIENIKINNYGNLKQKEINLKDNINIIYGKNETGKSTLLNYLKNIFYGISKNKNGKEISDYEKYLPWTGEEFSGKIKYQLNNGNIFEIFRDFNKKNPIIFDKNLENISADFKIDKKDGNQYFYEQTGIDEKAYLSTIMSPQQEVVLDNQSQSILVQKLANIAGTGEDKVSFQKAMDRLNKRLIEEVGTTRTQDRPMNIIQNKLDMITNDLKTKKQLADEKQKLESDVNDLKQKLADEENKNNILNKLNLLNQKYKIELEKNTLKNKIKNENKEKIKNKIEEKNNLEKNNAKNIKLNSEKNKFEKKYFIFGIIFILLIILNLFNFNLIKNKIIRNKENLEKEKIDNELKEKITILNSEINLLEENTKKLEKEINQEKEDILFKFNLEKKDILGEANNKIDFNIEEKTKIETELENSNKKIVEYKLKLNSSEYEENSINNKLEDFISKEEEYENLQEQLS